MTGITRAPARRSRRMALAAALVSLVAAGFFSWISLALGAAGVLLVAVGLARGSHRPLTVGSFGLLLGALAAGAGTAPIEPVLVAATGAVLAWDLGGTAVALGDQLGRAAETARLEAAHALGSVGVGVVTLAIGYGFYRTATGGQPVAALLFFLLAAVLLLEALG